MEKPMEVYYLDEWIIITLHVAGFLHPVILGAFPHTKKKKTIFARVHTGRKKRDLNRDYFFTRVPTQAEKSRPKSHRFERAVHVYCL